MTYSVFIQVVKTSAIKKGMGNGKEWIEEDWTEDEIATELVEATVSKEDIVLAFYQLKMRPYTEFAIA